ncbi:MAG: FAD-binding protein [Deltaproteobacteria bacterium]|nr:MAG: FAD-binding protein [Deltaproteobacteria bacterium]
MSPNLSTDVDVFVVGAGPTGLSAAIEAARQGLSVSIIDSKPHRSTYSKALVVHARTMETFESMGVSDAIRAAGVPFSALRIHPGQNVQPVRVDLMGLPWGDTRYPYWLSIPQYETERCLEEHLAGLGVQVQWNTQFQSLVDHGDVVETQIQTKDGSTRTVRSRWLVGCDGGRSQVREQAGLVFDRKNIGETFVLADVCGDTPHPEDEGTSCLSRDGVLFLVPMPEPKKWRIIAHIPNHKQGEPIDIDEPFVNDLLQRRLGLSFGAHDITWRSQFVLQQGVARNYRSGRVFIAGDAAHLHSPVGGQGLNTGVQDAAALLWRIAWAEKTSLPAGALLDSYTEERRAIAMSMVKTTTLATRVMTLRNPIVTGIRNFLVRRILPLRKVQRKLGRGVGMLDLVTKQSHTLLSTGPRTNLLGRRLPNPKCHGKWLHEWLHSEQHSLLYIQGQNEGWTQEFSAEGVATVPLPAAFLAERVTGAALELQSMLQDGKRIVVRPDRIVAGVIQSAEDLGRYAEEALGVGAASLQPS